jgi:hypothetical protein
LNKDWIPLTRQTVLFLHDSVYSSRFVKNYTDTQVERMNDLIDQALQMRADIAAGIRCRRKTTPFIVYRDSARLSDFSTGFIAARFNPGSAKEQWKQDSTQVVRTVRAGWRRNKETDESFDGALFLNLTSFLSANSIRA